MSSASLNYYDLLQVGQNCTPDELKKAYKKAALRHHPDKGGNVEIFKNVSLAYETLSDEAKRTVYDRSIFFSFGSFSSTIPGSGTSGPTGPGSYGSNSSGAPAGSSSSSGGSSGASKPAPPKKPPPGAANAGAGASTGNARSSKPRPSAAQLEEMTIRELKLLLTEMNVRSDDCFERAELIAKIKSAYTTNNANSAGGATSGAGPGGSSSSSGAASGHNNYNSSSEDHSTSSASTSAPFRGAAWDSAKYASMTQQQQNQTSGTNNPDNDNNTSRVKVISIGASNSGKSCLIKRFCEGRFVPRYISTIGVDYGVKTVFVQPSVKQKKNKAAASQQHFPDPKQKIKVNFFDLSGHEEFREIRVEFYENAQGVLVCYDSTNAETFRKLESTWLWEARTHGLTFGNAVCLLCANKCDLPSRQVTKQEGQTFAKEHGFYYFELSSQTGENVIQAFNLLFEKIADKLIAEANDLETRMYAGA
ncbi:unnamed protein product [Amoebophrya sp. A120]|nr:unnamed protein product [Amoebophrya sp. A120]|eukprot:GSA120T00009939001.1